jgi:hypothetical protein
VVHYDTVFYIKGCLCRHLSVQGPGKWPGMMEVRKLMKLAGFQAGLEGVISWADREPVRQMVHVLEPLDGNWAPLWSS